MIFNMLIRLTLISAICTLIMPSFAIAISTQNASINANVVAAMKEQFVKHVFLDNHFLIDIESVSACRTKFVTSVETVTIDWTSVENTAPETVGARDVLPITSPAGDHEFSAPNGPGDGDLDERMESGLGLLYLNCEPGS